MSLIFKDSLFDVQWLRAASHTSSGGAEIGECFAAARQIREPDPESWFTAWSRLGESVLTEAETSRTKGHGVSALYAYLRASNYFRAAYTFLIGAPVDPRVVDIYRRHRARSRVRPPSGSPFPTPVPCCTAMCSVRWTTVRPGQP